jgi:hypothetical protein
VIPAEDERRTRRDAAVFSDLQPGAILEKPNHWCAERIIADLKSVAGDVIGELAP